MNSVLRITDGTLANTVDLLNMNGWLLQDWEPSVPEAKGGGVYRDNPLTDGRKLVYRKISNIVDTFNMVANGHDQDAIIDTIQKLQQLLERATSYWTTDWQNQPVWIEARAPNETNIRYATIMDYKLTGFGNPFKQPFFGECESASEAVLAIEHSFWQETEPGADGTCVQASSEYYSDNGEADFFTNEFFPVESASDATCAPFGSLITDIAGHALAVGWSNVVFGGGVGGEMLCWCGVVFDNVTIPEGAMVTKAIIRLSPYFIAEIGSIEVKYSGQIGPANVFSGSGPDFLSRTRTNNYVIVNQVDFGYPYDLDITSIVNEIVNEASWTSGSDLAIFLEHLSGEGRHFKSWDEGSGFPALYVEYHLVGRTVGRAATCAQEIIIPNFQSRAKLTHIFSYNVSLDEYSSNLLDETLPYALLPNVANPPPGMTAEAADIGDYIFFGSRYNADPLSDSGPFHNLVFDLSQVLSGANGIWFDSIPGPAWGGLDTEDDVFGDQTILQKLGVGAVNIVHSPTHTHFTINGVDAYWTIFGIQTPTAEVVPPIQQNRRIYTAINPYLDIAAAQVPGDLPALMRIRAESLNKPNLTNMITMGLRSLSRGEEFTAFLNASDVQQPPYVTFAYSSDAQLVNCTTCPTYKQLHFNNFTPLDGEWKNLCSWTISGETSKEYIGVYHAFARVNVPIEVLKYGKFRLRAVFGTEYNASYSDSSFPLYDITYEQIIDLGQLVIQPNYTIRPADYINSITLYFDVYGRDPQPDWLNSYLLDIILIPADEWIGSFGTPGTAQAPFVLGNEIDIDGITNPRQTRATQISTLAGMNSIAAEWSRVTSSDPMLQHHAAQRMWFLQYLLKSNPDSNDSSTFPSMKVCLQRSARYLLARGGG